jgi:hypothetical protein
MFILFAHSFHLFCNRKSPLLYIHPRLETLASFIHKTIAGLKDWYVLITPACDLIDLRALQFISIKDKGNIGSVIHHWRHIDDARISVVTDGKSHIMRSSIIPLTVLRITYSWPR